MMNLFEILPPHFFRLLTGKYKGIYAEAILLLYEQTQSLRFGIRVNEVRDLFQELVETYLEDGQWISIEEDDDYSPQNISTSVQIEEVSRNQANALLRKLQEFGWIQVETRDQFEEYIVLPHFTSRIAQLFTELCSQRAVEYQRFAFETYATLSGEGAKIQPSLAIASAYESTRHFEKELITLYQNMKHHMDQIVEQTTIEDILSFHFNVYHEQILDRSYHRLKTSDHVSRYRFQILDKVRSWLLDEYLMEETIIDAVKSGQYSSREEAERTMRSFLADIEKIYMSLDDIFTQIDLRHNQFLRSSYDRARYLSQKNQGFDSRLAGLLNEIGQSFKTLPEIAFQENFTFELIQFTPLHEKSFYTPRKKRELLTPTKQITYEIPLEWKEKAKEAYLIKFKSSINRRKVEEFVARQIGSRPTMEIHELNLESVEDYLYLAHLFLYGHDKGSAYRLMNKNNRVIIQIGDYRLNDYTIVNNFN